MATHKELIMAHKFDEKFKSFLREYYCYGFKKPQGENLERLNNILADCMKWSVLPRRRTVVFSSVDSLVMEENPFHRVYRFCKYNPVYPAYFFHTMAALSPDIELREGLDSLEIDGEQRFRMEEAAQKRRPPRTSELLPYYTEQVVEKYQSDRNRTPNNRLLKLKEYGFVDSLQNIVRGDHSWFFPKLTMERLLAAGSTADEEFARHFHAALDFYSKYMFLGEVGTCLLDRMGGRRGSPFRFRHEYFMHALCDFDLIDLLYALEKRKWCLIKYRHGTADFETELLCWPLQIRVGAWNGREYLMYYEPTHRSLSGLRLEFVQAVKYYEDRNVKNVLSQFWNLTPGEIEADIEKARSDLKDLWGVSAAGTREGAAAGRRQAGTVKFRIFCDLAKDDYVLKRLRKESRTGTITPAEDHSYADFETKAMDPAELKPWVRSFYSRLISCDGIFDEGKGYEEDLRRMVPAFLEDAPPPVKGTADGTPRRVWGVPEQILSALGPGKEAQAHNHLFNEVLSFYYFIIADLFAELCAEGNEACFSREELDGKIQRAIERNHENAGLKTESLLPREIRELILTKGFVKASKREARKKDWREFSFEKRMEEVYALKYRCGEKKELYRSVVPLSKIEIRWLKTILKDQRISCFLSPKEAETLKSLLDGGSDAAPLPAEKVCRFDQFKISRRERRQEEVLVKTLLSGIYGQEMLYVDYQTKKNLRIAGEVKPVVLEFSKRNNRFQFICLYEDRVVTLNLTGIREAKRTGRSFDYPAALGQYTAWRDRNLKSVEILFYDRNNLADRLLTEFSPWKKKCSYHEDKELYKLKIYYQQQEELEMVIRLMGYGPSIFISDREHPICREIRKRLDRQMKLMREPGTVPQKDFEIEQIF